jgi:hypothetical protein
MQPVTGDDVAVCMVHQQSTTSYETEFNFDNICLAMPISTVFNGNYSLTQKNP